MFPDLYNEIAARIAANLSEILWCDLWHEQVAWLEEELPFPAPAVFIAFHVTGVEDAGTLVQQCNLQIDFYLFFETFADTYRGSANCGDTLEFLKTLTRLHALFHGRSGQHFSAMRRVDVAPEETGNAGNLYRISFECVATDYSAQTVYDEGAFPDVAISREPIPERVADTDPLYVM
ncbi:MAG: hypothetical protein LBL24_07530 [Bacteroidales bacterium]|jgi:hypothetical protein|nr:hypothetical protein [Bacteroidales bacterium]